MRKRRSQSIGLLSDSVLVNSAYDTYMYMNGAAVQCCLYIIRVLLHPRDFAWLAWVLPNPAATLLLLIVTDLASRFAEKPDERRRMREPRRIRNCTWRRPPLRGSCRSWIWGCSWTYRPGWITTNGWPRIPSHFLIILISSTARYPNSALWRVVPTWPVPA